MSVYVVIGVRTEAAVFLHVIIVFTFLLSSDS